MSNVVQFHPKYRPPLYPPLAPATVLILPVVRIERNPDKPARRRMRKDS